jgi:hypothetical protein
VESEVLVDSQTMWLVIAAVVVLVIAAGAWMYAQRQRRVRLRTHFGPEYERTVRETGSPAKAEALLAERAKRVRDLKIRRLSREQAENFDREWRRIQGMFVDDPDGAVAAADRLVGEVMSARGYPIEDFDTRAADLSVEHPRVVENYRIARSLAVRRGRGEAGTEELRQAVVNYRALFDDLLKTDEGAFRRAS